MGINLFHTCKHRLVALLNTEELLTCTEFCSCLEDQVVNHLPSFDDSIQHCRIWVKTMYSFIVGYNVFWAWVSLAFLW